MCLNMPTSTLQTKGKLIQNCPKKHSDTHPLIIRDQLTEMREAWCKNCLNQEGPNFVPITPYSLHLKLYYLLHLLLLHLLYPYLAIIMAPTFLNMCFTLEIFFVDWCCYIWYLLSVLDQTFDILLIINPNIPLFMIKLVYISYIENM